MRAWIGLLLMSMFMVSCGYHLRGNTRERFIQNDIRSLYIEPVKNNSFKAGTEIVVYNALRKRVAQGGYVRIVSDAKSADAILSATVVSVTNDPTALTGTDKIAPLGTGSNRVVVGTQYSASLGVGFNLVLAKTGKSIWADSLSRSKIYAASTYMLPLGATSPLINESELERALQDMAVNIVIDAEESMNAMF